MCPESKPLTCKGLRSEGPVKIVSQWMRYREWETIGSCNLSGRNELGESVFSHLGKYGPYGNLRCRVGDFGQLGQQIGGGTGVDGFGGQLCSSGWAMHFASGQQRPTSGRRRPGQGKSPRTPLRADRAGAPTDQVG